LGVKKNTQVDKRNPGNRKKRKNTTSEKLFELEKLKNDK
jgi:hypothetical protein